ncbi:cysteine desulfurase family protein [Neomoorella mulderi]|uniref:Cysteine desulfurase IscS n=1 Tax=Moorella mulderi DSM 14980 TaxID=1122241 RepID=A0A151AUR1_9FIRM|nr:cysteine desulfurase family protein [Moorella mulderi]KYH31414.1 cysteine desulfurase IscS [Moorella mulderi DSM 14980]
MQPAIYLDNSATTPVLPGIAAVMHKMLVENYGNPSSLHGLGIAAEKALAHARRQVAGLIGARPAEIYFTSGGTEANNWAVWGISRARRRQGKHIITTAVEHSSLLAACRRLEAEGYEVTYLPVDSRGVIRPADLEAALREDTILVSVMSVNNETGALQPVGEVARLVHSKSRAVLHVDHIQGYGKIPLNCQKVGIDLLSLSAHKIHGPKGTGALYIKEGLRLEPLLVGGEQEAGRRAGTENTAGIAAFGLAAELAAAHMEERVARMREIKIELATRLLESIPGARINGPPPEEGAPHILNVSFPGVRAEVLVHMLEQRGVYVSTGSACHSRKQEASHVLKALHLERWRLEGAIRISLGALNTPDEVTPAVEAIKECVTELWAL